MNAAVILQIIVGFTGIATLWAQQYYSGKAVAAREEKDHDAEVQQGRRDIVEGDADAVTARIGRVLDSAGSDAGSAGGLDQSGEARTLQRLSALGIRTGETPGESGGV